MVNGEANDATHALDIDVPGVEGTIAFTRKDDVVFSNLKIVSEGDVDIVFEYGQEARLGALRHPSDPDSRITVEDGGFRLHNRGNGEYFLMIELEEGTRTPLGVTVERTQSSMTERDVLFESAIDLENVPAKR
jgi:hypothetical protein